MEVAGYAERCGLERRSSNARHSNTPIALHRRRTLARLPMEAEAEAVEAYMVAGERRASPRTAHGLLRSGLSHLLAAGTPAHGNRIRVNQRRTVVAAAAPGTPAEKPAGGRGRVVSRRGGGFPPSVAGCRGCAPSRRRRAGIGLGGRRDERSSRRQRVRMPLWETQLVRRYTLPARSSPCGRHPRGRAACCRCCTRWKALNIVRMPT